MILPQGFLDIASVVLAVAVIIFVVLWGRRQTRMRLKTLEEIGFTHWTEVDARFLEAVRSLVLHTHPERLEIQRALRRILPDEQLVLFELVDKKRGGSNMRSTMLAVYKPGSDLPEFRLFPQSEAIGEGRQADVIKHDVERLKQFASEKFGEKPVDFTDQPDIAENFAVSAQDGERVRKFLNSERLRGLLDLPQGTVLQAGSEVVLIGRLISNPQKQTWEESLRERIDMATKVAEILLS